MNYFCPTSQDLLSLPYQFSLVYLDLHLNNVLIQNDHVWLFDKGSDLFAGDPLYDLSTLGIEFCDVLYGIGTFSLERKNLWDAFILGYGHDPLRNDAFRFMTYVFLRTLERFPNPFESRLEDIIKYMIGENGIGKYM